MSHPIIRMKRDIRVYETYVFLSNVDTFFMYYDYVWVSHLLIIASCDLYRLVSSRWDVGEQRGSPSQLTSAKSPSSPPDESRSGDHSRTDNKKTDSINHKYDNVTAKLKRMCELADVWLNYYPTPLKRVRSKGQQTRVHYASGGLILTNSYAESLINRFSEWSFLLKMLQFAY